MANVRDPELDATDQWGYDSQTLGAAPEPGWSVNGSGGTVPFADGGYATPPTPQAAPQVDNNQKVIDEYKSQFGRGPSGQEAASEAANLAKYGWDTGPYGGVKAQIDKRANNVPNQDGGSNGGGNVQPVARSNSGGGGSSSASSTSQSGPSTMDDIMGTLKGLFPGGAFNQDIVNRRTDSARDTLNQNRKSTMANNEAYLANRGLIGDGPQATAAGNLDSRLNSQFNSAYNDIYANESSNADQRMMQALQLATGMSTAQAGQAIDQFRAQTEKDLGFGGLALGNKQADNSFTLGQGNLALGNANSQRNYNLGQGGLDLGYDSLNSNNSNTREALRVALLHAGLSADEIAALGFI